MSGEKNKGHRLSHHQHSNLKPTNVLNNLKTKVKRKRLLRPNSFELTDGTSNKNINNNNNNQQSTQDQTDAINDTLFKAIPADPVISPTTLSNKYNISVAEDEQDSVVPNGIHEDEDIKENGRGRTKSLTTDTNSKPTTSQPMLIKATTSLRETSTQSNSKKRRQTFRRTGFQIRSEDFNAIFSDFPSDEQLIIAFPCAWRKDVFMHGKMFLSLNYFSFYTCFFKWEETICIPYKDIVSVTREKSALVVPNAIKVRTINQEQYLFACYIPREKVFIAIFRLWQNALLEQPLGEQQLRALIDADQQIHEETTGDSEESITLEKNGEFTSEPGLDTQPPPLMSTHSTELSAPPIPSRRFQRRVVSISVDNNEPITYLSTCTCENHLAKTYADRLFTFNVDTLFEFICGDNSFTRAFHDSQKLTDYAYGEWHANPETGKRERQVTYKAVAQSILGTNTLYCRERQILEEEEPHSMYVLNTEVYNEGMKYTDAFYVATRFCMVQKSMETCSLRVTAEIRYVKSVNSFVKTFIEKNANSSIEGGVTEQVQRLEAQQAGRKSNLKSKLSSQQSLKRTVNGNKHQKEMKDDFSVNPFDSSNSKLAIYERTITGNGIICDIALLIGICLLCLHVYLCYKLYAIDQVLLTSDDVCLNQCKRT